MMFTIWSAMPPSVPEGARLHKVGSRYVVNEGDAPAEEELDRFEVDNKGHYLRARISDLEKRFGKESVEAETTAMRAELERLK